MNKLQTPTEANSDKSQFELDRIVEQVSRTNNLKAIFLPVFDTINPYQEQLIEHLVDLGMQIEKGNPSNYLIPTVIKEGKPHILHLHWLHPLFVRSNWLKSLIRLTILITELYILRLMGVKIVWTAHNLKNHDSLYLKFDQICTRFIAKISHGIIAHSHTAKAEIIKTLDIKDRNKIFVVPHGNYIGYYDNNIGRVEARKKLNIPNQKIVMLLLGSIRSNKGVLELIEAFKRLKQEKVELLVAGKPANKEFEQLIKQKISEHENIQLKSGFVPDEEIQTYMNACDVVVFPYQEILTSGAVFLAMSFSKPCIAPRNCCLGEVLDHDGAFLYNSDCQDGLLQAMEYVINNQSKLINMGKHNLQLAEQFNWSKVADMTIKLYRNCLVKS
ncbi:glycosyltransferase family 4 protein [Calothrix sp. CCY 0018]|uniref:glycosyltransferase family 4 protein n=1 Tax=Calothrix sp. CCY 0018 TaxID=3103864 RepID=UPI0039C5DB35